MVTHSFLFIVRCFSKSTFTSSAFGKFSFQWTFGAQRLKIKKRYTFKNYSKKQRQCKKFQMFLGIFRIISILLISSRSHSANFVCKHLTFHLFMVQHCKHRVSSRKSSTASLANVQLHILTTKLNKSMHLDAM